MRFRPRFIAAASVLSLAAAFAVAPGVAAAQTHAVSGAHAVFVQTNDPTGNRVIAYHRNADGSLGDSTAYDTGGAGGRVDGAAVDPLASQGGLVYDAPSHLLFAVNAGSDTLTSFAVDGDSLSRLQVVGTAGRFPASVAVHGDLVYVLDALDGGAVSGYRLAGRRLHPIEGSTRRLDLPAAPSASKTFLFTPGQVGFTPDGGRLLVTTKASTSAIEVFPVGHDGRLAGPVSTPSSAPVPFGFVFDPAGRLVVGEAGGSVVSTYDLGSDGSLTHVASQADSQAALCWIAAAGENYYYVGNAGSGSVSGYRIDASGIPTLIVDAAFATPGVVATPGAGAIDLVGSVDGQFLYAESGGAGSVSAYRVGADGRLASAGVVTGLGAGVIEGIAAS